jgi:hypothetical protein
LAQASTAFTNTVIAAASAKPDVAGESFAESVIGHP